MADDARISTALPSHPKTRKLLKRLGAEGCWSLVCLFLWVANNRWNGNLAGLSDEDIEIASEWTGADGLFVRSLVEVGFLDGNADNYSVHDWAEHNPWAATRGQRIELAKRAAAARWQNAEGIQDACEPYAERIRDEGSRNAHHPTQPPPTQNLKTYSSEVNGTSDKQQGGAVTKKQQTMPSKAAERLAALLQREILRNKPDYRITPKQIRNWVVTADHMIRLDRRSEERIARLIEWVQHDEFWMANCLSMNTLREKYDQLEMKRERSNSHSAADSSSAPAYVPASVKFEQRVHAEREETR